MKLKIRYQTKADVPPQFAQFYGPVDPNEPDGLQMFSAFEPDPDGYALVNASKLQRDHETLRKDKERQDAAMKRYRKPDSEKGELFTPEEIAAAYAAVQELNELKKTVPDLDTVRRQVADQLTKTWEAKVKAGEELLGTERNRLQAIDRELDETLLMNASSIALSELKPKRGLADIAVRQFMQNLQLEKTPIEGQLTPKREIRVKGPNGMRLDAKGNPMSPREYAKSEFLREYGEMFEPQDQRNGTGATGSQNGPAPTGGGGGKGSGKHRVLQSQINQDNEAYRTALRNTPKGDHLQILDEKGAVVGTRPGLGSGS